MACSPRVAAGLALPVALAGLAADGIARVAFALPDTALLLPTEAKARDVDVRDGDGHDVLPLLAQHLAFRDVLAQVLANLPADDLPKPSVVLIDLEGHA
jgi:hypothetical protein